MDLLIVKKEAVPPLMIVIYWTPSRVTHVVKGAKVAYTVAYHTQVALSGLIPKILVKHTNVWPV